MRLFEPQKHGRRSHRPQSQRRSYLQRCHFIVSKSGFVHGIRFFAPDTSEKIPTAYDKDNDPVVHRARKFEQIDSLLP